MQYFDLFQRRKQLFSFFLSFFFMLRWLSLLFCSISATNQIDSSRGESRA